MKTAPDLNWLGAVFLLFILYKCVMIAQVDYDYFQKGIDNNHCLLYN